MTIVVSCPNGHRLSCPDDRAGMSGTCPSCGTTFQVPRPGVPDDPDSIGVGTSAETVASSTDEDAARELPPLEIPMEVVDDVAEQERMCVFLCPNGHKLNGPASLQGTIGQCPHCNIKFEIPIIQEEEASDADDQAVAGKITGHLRSREEFDEPLAYEEIDEPGTAADPKPLDFEGMEEFREDDHYGDADTHPLAKLFKKLWTEREHGGVVELHLADGVKITPDWWAKKFSRVSHAVFSLQSSDGSYTIETIAWDAVQRVTVRRITELPDGVFE